MLEQKNKTIQLPVTQKQETEEVFHQFLEVLDEEQQKEFKNFLVTAKALVSMNLLKPSA